MDQLTSARRTLPAAPLAAPAAPAPALQPAAEPAALAPQGSGLPTDGDSAFWNADAGSGVRLALALAPQIDLLAAGVAALPVHAALTRPVVGQYLSVAGALASSWSLHSRPALLAALGALAQFGASVGQPFVMQALAERCADNGRAAQRVIDALQRRLAAPLAAFAELGTAIAGDVAQMARATALLDADNRLLTQRLQADQAVAFLLSQQASALQGKLDDAQLRTRAGWLAAPQATALRQECTLHGCALDGLRRQRDQLRAAQAVTAAEAHYLHSVMPVLAPCLAAVERLGTAIGAIGAGLPVLVARLTRLGQALAAGTEGAGAPGEAPLEEQLLQAREQWHVLAAGLARLRQA